MMMQERVVAGSSLSFVTTVADYPASAGWTLKFRLVPRSAGNQPIELTATAEGDDHRIAVAATVTATWAPDWYGWAAWVEKAGEVYDLDDSGQTEVRPNPRTVAAGTDLRSQAERGLEEARASLAAARTAAATSNGGRVPIEYTIAGRTVRFGSAEEAVQSLIREIRFWEGEVARERRAARLAACLDGQTTYRVAIR